MRTIIQILILTISFIQIGFSQSQSYLLNKAYKKNSIEMLTQFFENWESKTPSNETSVTNDTIKEAYNVFKGFYKPTQLLLLGGSEWGDSIYAKAKYLVIQAELGKIQFADKVYFTQAEKDSIIISRIANIHAKDTSRLGLWIRNYKEGNLAIAVEIFESDSSVISSNKFIDICSIPIFRPTIDQIDKKAIYLTPKYSKIINNFLGNTHSRLGKGGIMNPARSKGSSKKKMDFLDNMIAIFYGHWGGYWQLHSYPYAYSITFDRNMKYARVDYRMVYEGGKAILEKHGDQWIIVHGERTWIE